MALRDRDLAGNGAFGVFGQITGAVERRTSEEKLGEVSAETIAAVRQTVLRAHAAASAGDKNACEQALAEAQRAIGRPRAPARFQAALPRGLRDSMTSRALFTREWNAMLGLCGASRPANTIPRLIFVRAHLVPSASLNRLHLFA
jgi:hypothetical protein